MGDIGRGGILTPVDPVFIKELAELVDGNAWDRADRIAEEFPPRENEKSGMRTGLYEDMAEASERLRREYGIDLAVNTMRISRATSLAWPADTRVSAASFEVHKSLRGRDSEARMRRYLKRNKGRPLSIRDVQRYKAEDNPKPVVPWEKTATRKLWASVRTVLLGGGAKPNKTPWWKDSRVTPETKTFVIRVLRAIANDIEA